MPSTDLVVAGRDRHQFGTAVDLADYTRDLVGTAFRHENTTRQADRDPTRLTMSGLGGCTRAAAYQIAGTPPSDVVVAEEARQAMLGTWIHEHLLPSLGDLLHADGSPAVVEEPVELHAASETIRGTLDLATDAVVWDLKSVREWRLGGVRRRGTYSEHRVQVLGYALARYQAGYPVRWVVWLYIDRSTGQVHVEVEEFTNAAALSVINRVGEIRFFADDNPDLAPRRSVAGDRRNALRGPGLSFQCDRCPWLRRCWGDDAVPGVTGAQKSVAATDAGIEYALALYERGAEGESGGKSDKEFAKLILAEVPDGVYGAWEYRHGRPGSQRDWQEVERHYAELGMDVPKVRTAPPISVKRVK